MHFFSGLSLLGCAALAHAHFQLQYPPPRGEFVEDDEPTFCDGYKNPAANRTEFPLSGGFFSINSEHPSWTAGVLVSSAQNPTSFNNFTQVVPFFKASGEGKYCLGLDLSSGANGTSFKDGQNVTVQFIYNGGDDQLYQCADLTLKSNFTIANDVQCSNATGPNNGRPTATTPGASSTGSGSNGGAAPTQTNSAAAFSVGALILALGPFAASLL